MGLHSLRVASGVVCLSATVALAAPPWSAASESGGGIHRLLVGGVPVQTTTDAISDARAIELPGNAAALLWRQVDPQGASHRWYVFNRDAADPAGWSRPIDSDTATLELRWERFDPLDGAPRTHPVPQHLAAAADNRAYIVQFVVPPFDALRTAVEHAGGMILAYLPTSALIVDLDAAALASVRALPGVRWVGAFEPAYKSDPDLLRGYLPKFGASDAQAQASFAANWSTPYVRAAEALARGEAVSFWIQVHQSGLPMKQIVAHEIGQLGGKVQDITPDDNMMRALLTQEQLVGVLRLSEVAFVDPWSDAEQDMDIERQISGANTLETATGMSGQGVHAEVMDAGFRATHQAFTTSGVPPLIRTNSTDTSHGSSTYGIIFGNGAGNAAGRGLIPSAEVKAFYTYTALSGFGGTNSRLTVTSTGVQQNSIVFQSNSWGSATTTAYTTVSQAMDQAIFQTGLLICQSQSNTGTRSSRPEAWAKNVLAVGAFNHGNDLNRANDTVGGGSIGPAADNRTKPELSHHYDNVLCTTNTSDTAYTPTFGGTSAATPITCGYMGLIFQMWHSGLFPGHGQRSSVFDSRPSEATARALAINAAYRYDWSAPGAGSNASITRNVQGWGVVDVARLLALAPTIYAEDEVKSLAAGQRATYTFDVAPGATGFAATMAYADPPGNVSATVERINDLSLRVTGPDGTIWWGNRGLTASNVSTSGGTSNTIDTVENVLLRNPPAGRYTVDVFADVVAQDGNPRTPAIDASYSLVVSGGARTPLRVLTLDDARTGACAGGNGPVDLGFADSPVFAPERQWLGDPFLFGGGGRMDRPVSILPAVSSLTPEAIAATDVLVITGLAAPLTACERASIARFVRQGGGVIALYQNAAQDLGTIFGALPGGSSATTVFDPASTTAPEIAGPFGTVNAQISGGPCRLFDTVGPRGSVLLTAAGQPVAASFTLGAGRAVLINDADWAAGMSVPGCLDSSGPSTVAKTFFLNALASVSPRTPLQFAVGCCPSADFDTSGAVDMDDLFSFIGAWFAGDPSADFNGGGLAVQDVLDYITAWFAGC